MKNLFAALIVVGFAFSMSAWADEPQQPERPVRRNWKSVFVVGASYGGKTTYTLKDTSGNSLGTSSDTASAGILFDGELTYQSESLIGFSLIVEGTRYNYSNAVPSVSDGEFGMFAMPRLAVPVGHLEFWGGAGIGFMITTIGGSTSETLNGLTITLTDTTPVGFAWTARAGVDLDLGPKVFVGGEFMYIGTNSNVGVFATNGTNSGNFSESFSRKWLASAVRLGARF